MNVLCNCSSKKYWSKGNKLYFTVVDLGTAFERSLDGLWGRQEWRNGW